MNEKTAYPLCWPDGWRRTPGHERQQSAFGRGYYHKHPMGKVREFLAIELERLGAVDAIMSTNIKTRADGQPLSSQTQPTDTGAAVFFKLNGKPVALACDRWNRVECNLWAIGKHVESIRGQDRWGVGNTEQAFRGYLALPQKASGVPPWEILGVIDDATEDEVKTAYRKLAAKYHPDNAQTGDHAKFAELQNAFNLMMQNVKGAR